MKSPSATIECHTAMELIDFLSRYVESNRNQNKRPLNLKDSLKIIAGIHNQLDAKVSLPSDCRCLITGYASPGNAASLRSYLNKRGVRVASLTAVDIYELPSVYASLGIEHPPMDFIRADACDLSSTFVDSSIDLLVQDFLLNCVPHSRAEQILSEASRVLSPEGLFFISFTDSSCLAEYRTITRTELLRRWSISLHPDAYEIGQITSQPMIQEWIIEELNKSVILGDRADQYIYITRPHGRFEFFNGLATTLQQIKNVGLEVLGHSSESGQDDHGLICRRHRLIMRKAA